MSYQELIGLYPAAQASRQIRGGTQTRMVERKTSRQTLVPASAWRDTQTRMVERKKYPAHPATL